MSEDPTRGVVSYERPKPLYVASFLDSGRRNTFYANACDHNPGKSIILQILATKINTRILYNNSYGNICVAKFSKKISPPHEPCAGPRSVSVCLASQIW